MSKNEKLIKRFFSNPKDFTWEELVRFLKIYNYFEKSSGKTGGSRRKFINKTRPPIILHKPHPKNIVKSYIINEITELFKKEKLL